MTLLIGLSILPVLVILISLHELGHLLAAAACRAKPLEFGIGLPPRATAIHIGNTRVRITPKLLADLSPGQWIRCISRPDDDGTLRAFRVDTNAKPQPGMETAPIDALIHEGVIRSKDGEGIHIRDLAISINWLPLGGFVRIAGEEHSSTPRGLASRSWPQRSTVALAGVTMNLLIALPLLVAAQWTQMQPPATVAEVLPGSPAQQAGILAGDRIVTIGGKKTKLAQDAVREIRLSAGRPTQWQILRRQQTISVTVHHHGTAGIHTGQAPTVRLSMGDSAQAAAQTYARATHLIVTLPKRWIEERQAPEISGPIMTGKVLADVSRKNGITAWLTTTALISLSVGIINMLPLPPLDGFKMGLLLVEAARKGERLDPKKERTINVAGYAAMLTLATGICIIETLQMLI